MANMHGYVSNELIHFVGRRLETDSEKYNLLKAILTEGRLSASGGKGLDPTVTTSPKIDYFNKIRSTSVCFCDIPFRDLQFHMHKYGKFGISFTKSFLCGLGANPVFYFIIDQLEEGGGMRFNKKHILDEIVDIGEKICAQYENGKTVFDAKITTELGTVCGSTSMTFREWYQLLVFHIFSHIKPVKFADNLAASENFYMEREWRTLGDIRFETGHVHRVIIPRVFAKTFYGDFASTFEGQLSFSDDFL
jgi:hypothetical protein